MASHVCYIAVLLFVYFFTYSYGEDDTAVMKRLASMLSPIPLGWNNSNYCNWPGIACDNSSRVSAIDLAHRSLSGSLPSDFNSLSHLISLSLQNNHLSGMFPSLANLKSLKFIYLDSNNFSSIPDGAFVGLTSLEKLTLGDNPKLSPWTVPTQFPYYPVLQQLNASATNLGGPIPDIFSSLPALVELDLSYNHLTGPLPQSLSRSSIQYLWLQSQSVGLSGPLDVFANMSSLRLAWLHANKFTGPIPNVSSTTSSLYDLQLKDNLVKGIVPTSLMSFPNLAYISLQNNKLQGPLPVFNRNVTATVGATTNRFCKVTPGACDPQVMALLQVAGALGYPLELADSWEGDNACKQWTSIKCDSSGNVIIIDFARQHFQGTISSAFGHLTSLIELHLNDNNLTGTLPQRLTALTHLRTLDVSNNNILPPLPQFASSVNLTTSGNSRLPVSTPTGGTPGLGPRSKLRNSRLKTSLKINLFVLLGVFVAFILVVWILARQYKKRKHLIKQQKEAEQLETSLQLLPDSPVRFTYEILKAATSNFDIQRRLGGGGFGSVFEGTLSDGTQVGVKRLDRFGQGKKEFLAEVRTMGSIHHVNLVKLVGFCVEKTHRLLVYEYMSNGSLDKWIFHNDSRISLDWDTRKKIIMHIAKGLSYLHEDCLKRIAHLDVKPQNVLLDAGFNAKLSDFGLAKLIERDQSHVMTQMRGTRGYLAPEWLDRKITEKADVYSYGVVVLEVVFERKNLDNSPPEESDNRLIYMVRKKVEASQLPDLLDNCSEDMRQNAEEVEKTVKLALWCLHMDPRRRPSMSMVVNILEGSMGMDFISDCDLIYSAMDTEAQDGMQVTHISDSVLSGPRS